MFQMPTSCLRVPRCLLHMLPFPSIHRCIIYNQCKDACAVLLDLISSTHFKQSLWEKINHCSHCRLPQVFSGRPHRSSEGFLKCGSSSSTSSSSTDPPHVPHTHAHTHAHKHTPGPAHLSSGRMQTVGA